MDVGSGEWRGRWVWRLVWKLGPEGGVDAGSGGQLGLPLSCLIKKRSENDTINLPVLTLECFQKVEVSIVKTLPPK